MKAFLPRPRWQFALAIFAVVLLSKPAGTGARRLHAPSDRNLEQTVLSSEDGHEGTDIADLLELEDASEVQPESFMTPIVGTSWYCDSVCSVASHISQACHNTFGKWGRARCNDFCHACDASCSGHPFAGEWQRLQVKFCKPMRPTRSPSKTPSASPTTDPTMNPTTDSPSKSPSSSPSTGPTRNPSVSPTTDPTKNPTKSPSKAPQVSSISANKVRVDKSYQYLHMREVIVTDLMGNNVAINGTASQSSTFRTYLSASNAADGDLSTFSHTNYAAVPSDLWWEIALGGYYDVANVTIYNRFDSFDCGSCAARLSGAVVSLINEAEGKSYGATIGDATNVLEITFEAYAFDLDTTY